jgi:hypothetical protein
VIAEFSGLGKLLNFCDKFSVTTTPTAVTYNYRTLATADTAEALDLGDVTTVEMIIIKAIGAIDVDTTYVSSFASEIRLAAGEVAMFKPVGTVYVKNYTALATPAYEYWVCGTT